MRNFTFILKDNEGNEKEIALRLISSDCEKIEKTYNCTLIDYVQQCSVTSIVTLLQYMRAGTGENFTRNMAHSFYDELVDNGYTLARILDEIIYETLAVSGIISQEDLKNIREENERINNMTTEEKQKAIEERKN